MGYAVKIEDGQGNEKKFFCARARSHEQGNSLASGLIEHLTATYPGFAPFSTRSVEPSKGGVGFEDIREATDADWP